MRGWTVADMIRVLGYWLVAFDNCAVKLQVMVLLLGMSSRYVNLVKWVVPC